MVSFYNYVQFRDLKMKDYITPNSSKCNICRYRQNKNCDCIQESGVPTLSDKFDPIGTLVYEKTNFSKREEYFDEIVNDLINCNGTAIVKKQPQQQVDEPDPLKKYYQ